MRSAGQKGSRRMTAKRQQEGTIYAPLWVKVVIALMGAGVIGGGGAMMISSDDAKQMVQLGVIERNQEDMKTDIEGHEGDINGLQIGQTTIKANQGEATRERARLSTQLRSIERKIDEIRKGETR